MKIDRIGIKEFYNYHKSIRQMQEESYLINFNISKETAMELSEEKNSSLEKNLNTGNCYLYGAFEEEEIAAFIWFFEHLHINQKRLHINQIVVNSDYRRRGLATKLVKVVEEKAIELDIKQIDLNVSAINEKAIQMYSKMNFQNERILMSKKLS